MHEPAHRPARVVVVGSYAIGLVMRTARIPTCGETVLGSNFQSMDGGKGSNQAIACARLGAQTVFIAAVGDDTYGDRALALLADEGVDTRFIRRVPGMATGAGFIMVDDKGDNAIAVDLGANRSLAPADIDGAAEQIAAADIVLVQLEIPLATARHALAAARRAGARTILNPAPAQPLGPADLAHVDVLTPNLTEAQLLSGLVSTSAADLGVALRRGGVGTVVVTLGVRGASIVRDGQPHAVPTHGVAAVDTTGAGDAFSAALAVALGEGSSLDAAVAFACSAGAYSVQSMGTVPSYATRSQLRAFMERTALLPV